MQTHSKISFSVALLLLAASVEMLTAFVLPKSTAVATRRAIVAATTRSSTTTTTIATTTSRFMTATTETSTQKQDEEEATTHPYDFSMDDIVSLCKRRGIIFPSSEIYNGYAGFYDYGPLGSELKKNVKDAWWKSFVTQREDVVGLDSSIIHNPTTWKSSGTTIVQILSSCCI